MAIFYDRICGAQQEENNPVYWTYIRFPGGADKVPIIYSGPTRVTGDLNIASTGDSPQITNYGRVIVEKGGDLSQKIEGSLTLDDVTADSVTNNSIKILGDSSRYGLINTEKISSGGGGSITEYNLKIMGPRNKSLTLVPQPYILLSDTIGIQFKSSTYSFSLSNPRPVKVLDMNASNITFWGGQFKMTGKEFKSEDTDSQITAGSFNATSDIRAKINLTELPFSDCLNFVNSTPVYAFTYKDSNKPSIGVLAQDLLKNTGFVNNFSLVDNVDATGENGDYMSVKESKLVYVLWSAVQELSKQVNFLRDEIESLKSRGDYYAN